MSLDSRTKRYPVNAHEFKGMRPNGPGHAKRNVDGATSRKDNSEGTLQDKYSPEDLFLMLKEYEFKGRLASVGIKGPTESDFQQESESSDSSNLSQSPTSNKIGKQDIWTDEAEFAFLAAELYLPPATSSKVMFMQKPCGRNEIIALIISLALGKHMTRKQVSSHLQVVRQRKKMNAEVKGLFDQNANDRGQGRITSPETGTPKLYNIHRRLYEIIGVDYRYNLSDMVKPQWIVRHERDLSQKPPQHQRGQRKSQYRTTHTRGLPRHNADRVEQDNSRTKYLEVPLSTKQVRPRERQAQPGPTVYQHQAMASTYFAYDPTADMDELESDIEEQDIERVSESTPRASPGPEDMGDLTISNSSSFRDLELRYISVGSHQGHPAVHAELPSLLDRIQAADIPDIVLRFAQGSVIQAKGADRRCIHVVVGTDIGDLTKLGNGFLDFDLIISANVGYLPLAENLPVVCSSSGYLDLRSERIDTIGLEPAIASSRGDRGGRISLRPIDLYEDDLLIQLINSSADPVNTVLPYFWLMQDIVTLQDSLRIIYTFRADSRWSLSVKQVI